MEPGLSKVIGSDILETQIRRLQPDLHLFGHTHILPMDLTLEGIRYVQWPLGYKRESTTSCQMMFRTGPLLVHDTRLGNMKEGIPPHMPSLDTTWAKYYQQHARDASQINQLAPWVKARFESFGLKEETNTVGDKEQSAVRRTAMPVLGVRLLTLLSPNIHSDLHANNESNQQWVREYCARKEEDQEGVYTVFILPGDIGSDLDKIRSVLSVLVKNCDAVCYVPGNHEAWKKGSYGPVKYDERGHPLPLPSSLPPSNQIAENSVEKIVEILLLAESLGVHYGPIRITSTHKSHRTLSTENKNSESESTGITCEFAATVVDDADSWYHSGWDTDPDVTHSLYVQSEKMMPFQKKWSDFYMCSWPEDMISQADFTSTTVDNTVLAEAFAKLNEQFLYPVPE
eukprot:gene32345-39933_t